MAEPRSFFSLSAAAKQTGKSKSVISSAIKSGRMSAEKNGKGHYSIDPAELFRVFPKNEENTSSTGTKERNSTPKENGENALRIKELELEVKFKDKEIISLEKQVAKAETQAESWENQAQTLLLTHKPQQKTFPWSRAVAASLIIASLAVSGTMAVLSPEKLAFLNMKEPQAVAAIPTNAELRTVEPAAGMLINEPEEGAQTPFNSLEEDATKN